MSSLVTTGPQDWTRPYGIYDGRRMGDEFLEYHMGQAPIPAPAGIRTPAGITWTEAPADLDVLQDLANYYNMGQVNQLFSAAQSVFGNAVGSIEFRSQISPPIVVNQPFAQGQGGAPPQAQVQGGSPFTAAFMSEAKPAVYIHLTDGTVYPIEPYGTPVDDYYTPYILAGVGVTLALGAIIGIKIGQRMFCAKPVAAKS